MKISAWFTLLGLVFVFGLRTDFAVAAIPDAKLTVKVVDEDQRPLACMPVHVWLSEKKVCDGETDTNGFYVVEGPCSIKDVPISIGKSGYYDSRLSYGFPNYQSVKNGKWQPWNPVVTAVVRRVVNPIPMYAKRVEMSMPREGIPVGFDLVAGDWVLPFGKGKIPDFLLLLKRRVSARNDYEGTLSLLFTNSFDGIGLVRSLFDDSEFMLPRHASVNGYQSNYVYQVGESPSRGRYGAHVDDAKEYFFFRVRSVPGVNGQPKSAIYGSLSGGIRFAGVLATNNVRVVFTYCLNPTPNDRNMEFDPKRNLFDSSAGSLQPSITTTNRRPFIGWE